jgi:hypothetical protein
MKKSLIFASILTLSCLALVLVVFKSSSLHIPLAQAQTSCSEGVVNLQVRKTTGTETPWLEGSAVTATQGERIDLNCFSRSGAQLLTGGQITGTVSYQGQNTTVTVPAYNGTRNQARNLLLSSPGTYNFICRNSSGSCTSSDSVLAAPLPGATPSPLPSPTPSVVPSPVPTPTPNVPVTSSCLSMSVVGGTSVKPGAQVRFQCNGSGTPSYYFFSYRQDPNKPLELMSEGPDKFSNTVTVGDYLHVQCNPCIGTTCASAQSVNSNCNFEYRAPGSTPSPTPSPSPANSPADLNKDGKVDINDYQLFVQYYRAAQ